MDIDYDIFNKRLTFFKSDFKNEYSLKLTDINEHREYEMLIFHGVVNFFIQNPDLSIRIVYHNDIA